MSVYFVMLYIKYCDFTIKMYLFIYFGILILSVSKVVANGVKRMPSHQRMIHYTQGNTTQLDRKRKNDHIFRKLDCICCEMAFQFQYFEI